MRYVDSNSAIGGTNYVSKPDDREPPEHTRKLARDIVTNHRKQGVNVCYSKIDPDCPWIGHHSSVLEAIDAYTSLVECLVQWYAGDRGFLGLVWTGNICHAFRCALAHARHGIGMATAWTVDHPERWDQRDDSRRTIRVMTVGSLSLHTSTSLLPTTGLFWLWSTMP